MSPMVKIRLLAGTVATVGLCLLIAFALSWAGSPTPSLAAEDHAHYVGSLSIAPLTSQITCTLATTTTTSLPGIDSFANAAILADYTGLALVNGTPGAQLNPGENYFRLDNATLNWTYEVRAVPDGLGNYNLGMILYDGSYDPILTDTNTFDGNSAVIDFEPDGSTAGPYYFKVFQYSDQCSGGTYHLEANVAAPTSTPGPGPTATPTSVPTPLPPPTAIPGADRFEPNYDFDTASTLATDVTYDNLNFVPWAGGGEDNDFYKIWVKPNLLFTCETLNLDPGLDTNMIIYNNSRDPIAGNDDIALGDYRSRIAYFSTYEGFMYVLVGHGGRFPLAEVDDSSYSLRCSMGTPSQPTATTRPPAATATPRSPTPTAPPSPASPLPTPTSSAEGLTVRLLSTPTPPPAQGTPSLRFVPVDLIVYYDSNGDRQPGAGEGVAGIMVIAFDTASGLQIAQGFTDELGRLEFTAASQGLVQLSVPYLGVAHMIGEEGATLYMRISPGSAN